MSEFYSGSNAQYGKRKRSSGGGRSGAASKLSRQLFFKKGAPAPIINAKTIDKAVGRALKSRMIASPEQKFIEVTAAVQNVSTTTTLNLLNGVVQGDTDNTRTGTKIRTTKIEFTAVIQLNQVLAGAGVDAGKISLFIAKQVNEVAPASGFVTPVGNANAPYTSGAASYPVLKNALCESQFYIIKDWDYNLQAGSRSDVGGITTYGSEMKLFKCEVPISRVVTFDDSNAGNVTDIITNAFYLGTVGSNAVGVAPSVLSWFARIYYTDM